MPAIDQQREWARRGAQVRLTEIEAERSAILKVFPELRGTRSERAVAPVARVRPNRTISPAGRKAMSKGMKKYWAKRRAQTTQKNQSKTT